MRQLPLKNRHRFSRACTLAVSKYLLQYQTFARSRRNRASLLIKPHHMKSSYFFIGIVALAVIGGGWYFLHMHPKAPALPEVSQPQASMPASSAPVPGQAGVTPLNTNLGSVSGVDLSSLGTEANQSASLSSQDGSQDAQTMSGDGQAITSSTDSAQNPLP